MRQPQHTLCLPLRHESSCPACPLCKTRQQRKIGEPERPLAAQQPSSEGPQRLRENTSEKHERCAEDRVDTSSQRRSKRKGRASKVEAVISGTLRPHMSLGLARQVYPDEVPFPVAHQQNTVSQVAGRWAVGIQTNGTKAITSRDLDGTKPQHVTPFFKPYVSLGVSMPLLDSLSS